MTVCFFLPQLHNISGLQYRTLNRRTTGQYQAPLSHLLCPEPGISRRVLYPGSVARGAACVPLRPPPETCQLTGADLRRRINQPNHLNSDVSYCFTPAACCCRDLFGALLPALGRPFTHT